MWARSAHVLCSIKGIPAEHWLFRSQWKLLKERGLVEIAQEMSRHVAERDNSSAPNLLSSVHVMVMDGSDICLQHSSVIVSAELIVTGGVVTSCLSEMLEQLFGGQANVAELNRLTHHVKALFSKRRVVRGQIYIDVNRSDIGRMLASANFRPYRYGSAVSVLGMSDVVGTMSLDRAYFNSILRGASTWPEVLPAEPDGSRASAECRGEGVAISTSGSVDCVTGMPKGLVAIIDGVKATLGGGCDCGQDEPGAPALPVGGIIIAVKKKSNESSDVATMPGTITERS
ncbi:MAG: hypothetical protein SGPRY_009981 [Prymnesium sp.]